MRALVFLGLVACQAGGELTDEANETGEAVYAIDSLPEYSGGACPTVTAGHQDFISAGVTRDIRVEFPAEPQGAPLVFAWHWLGGSADQIMNFAGFASWPATHGAIVVAPESRGLAVEWDSWADSENPDTILFDDVVRCLAEQHEVDLDRIYSTGFSAGAMWTVSLTHHRSSILAATAPLSGGATIQTWNPESAPPVLLTWGGSGDTYGTYSFETGSLDLSDQLAASGQFRAHCVHDDGHSLPPSGTDYVWEFFEAHPRGVQSPWANQLPASLPSFCTLP